MDRIGFEREVNPNYSPQGFQRQGSVRQSTNTFSSPGMQRHGGANHGTHPHTMMGDAAGAAGYTSHAPIDPEQEQNLRVAAQELSDGRYQVRFE